MTARDKLSLMADEIHNVIKFLRKMGYRQTEKILKEESKMPSIEPALFEIQVEAQSGITSAFLHVPSIHDVQTHANVRENFQSLLNWSRESLDMFRSEFESVLFPLFIHTYLDLLGKSHIKEGMIS